MLSHFSHVQLPVTVDCSLPGSSVHEILQARTLEWISVPSSGDLPCPGKTGLMSFMSPAWLVVLTTSITWKTLIYMYVCVCIYRYVSYYICNIIYYYMYA